MSGIFNFRLNQIRALTASDGTRVGLAMALTLTVGAGGMQPRQGGTCLDNAKGDSLFLLPPSTTPESTENDEQETDKYVAQLEKALQLRQQRVMVEECDQACKEMLRLVTADVTTRRNEPVLKWEQSAPLTKSTVGLMVKKGVVTNILAGAPAFASKMFLKGDRIIAIDGVALDSDSSGLTTLLIGNDEPGSSVTISAERECTASTITSPGEAVLEKPHKRNFEVTLTRASTAELIDKRRMFQLFTQVKALTMKAGLALQNTASLTTTLTQSYSSVPFSAAVSPSQLDVIEESLSQINRTVDDLVDLW